METNNTGNPEKSCETCGNKDNKNFKFGCKYCDNHDNYIPIDYNNCNLCKHNDCSDTITCEICRYSSHNKWEPKEEKASNNLPTKEDLGDKRCDYCTLEKKGSYISNGFVVSCEGSHCDEAYENYLEENSTSEEEIIEDKCSSCGNKDNKSFKLCVLSCGKNNNYSYHISKDFHSCETCENNNKSSMCMGCSFMDHDHWEKIKTKVEIDNKLPEKINDNFKEKIILDSTPSGENVFYKQYLNYFNERRIMSDLVTEIKTLEKVTYIIPAAGHNKGTIIPKSERNEDGSVNKIHLTKKEPKLSEEILEKIQFAGEYTISVDKTFNVKDATVTITDGLIVIEVPVQKDYVTEITVK